MAKVLFVEDQFELRAVHSAYLTSHGYQVVTAEDGDTGLEMVRSEKPDLLVLDHSLPSRSGVQIAEAMREDPRLAGIPIVMMTAMPFGAIGKKALAAGCKSFLSKPCTPSRLLREVQRFV